MKEEFFCRVSELDSYQGYYVSRKILSPETGRLLLALNCEVNDGLISALTKWGIEAIWISPEEVDTEESFEQPENSIADPDTLRTKSILKETFKEVAANMAAKVTLKRDGASGIDRRSIEKIETAIADVIELLSKNPTASVYLNFMDDKDPYLIRHTASVTYLALSLVSRDREVRYLLGDRVKGIKRYEVKSKGADPSSLVSIGVASLLHDIGKVTIFDIISQDVTFKMSDRIWEKIKRHPKIGHDVLFGQGLSPHSLLGIKYHHENMDGSGYPYGIKGYKIHPYARLIRVVDSFDAACSNRPGRTRKDPQEVLEELVMLSDVHYDPDIVRSFINLVKPNLEEWRQ